MSKLYDTQKEIEKVILIAIDKGDTEFDVDSCLDELEDLTKTAGAVVVGRMVQKRESMHRGHYFGKGKIEELKAFVELKEATGVICDDELTANQMRNMENILDVKIMNRTLLILDIFAAHAISAEGKLQVELAQLKYNLSHLVGQRKYLSRQGGGIGTRGPGEKKLETDRRNIADRIAELRRTLEEIDRHRQVMRDRRMQNNMPIVALVGYTNAGKSTMMNTITGAGVLEANKLFATLDTTTRKIELPSGVDYLFTDTVGFIQKLPHGLIQAFRATLEEVKFADILVHVVDASNPAREDQMSVVYKTLKELGSDEKPTITVFNKMDKEVERPLPDDMHAIEKLYVSAKSGMGVDKLLETIEQLVKSFKKSIKIILPYDQGQLLNLIHSNCEVISQEHREQGVYFELFADEEMNNRLSVYMV